MTAWTPRINQGPYIIFNTQQLLFMIVSILANSYILFYHYTNAPHPKFTISWLRRVCIKTHIIAGSIGVIIPLYVFFSTNQTAGLICMWTFVAWDMIFAISAYIQSPSVYGVRSITVPLYYVCVGCKVFLNCCLIQSLVTNPVGGYKSQVEWLWMCWVIHQTYAWVRIWYMTFFWADAVLDHQYTASVFLAGSMCVGASLGFYLWVVWMASMLCNYAYIHYSVKEMQKEEHIGKLRRLSVQGKLSREEDKDMAKARELSLIWHESQANCWRNYPEAAKNAVESLKTLLRNKNIEAFFPDGDRLNLVLARKLTPEQIQSDLLFDFIRGERYGVSEEDLTHFLIAFGVSNKSASCFFTEKAISKEHLIYHNDFFVGFRSFYVYAFNGLIDWTEMTEGKSTKNYLREIVNKEQHMKCPFRRNSRTTDIHTMATLANPLQLSLLAIPDDLEVQVTRRSTRNVGMKSDINKGRSGSTDAELSDHEEYVLFNSLDEASTGARHLATYDENSSFIDV
jgi:hypothetical protein